jgi:hypothetical protein
MHVKLGLTARKEDRMRTFENRVLRRIFRPKSEKVEKFNSRTSQTVEYLGFEVLTAVSTKIVLMMEAARTSETLVNF